MKKVSLLIALALLVTVGGVYATWNYGQEGRAAQAEVAGVAVTLSDVAVSGKGEFVLPDRSSATKFSIQLDDKHQDYKADLMVFGDAYKFSFNWLTTDQTIIDAGVTAVITLSVDGYNEYKGQEIIEFKDIGYGPGVAEIVMADSDADGKLDATINDALLISLLKSELELPTYQDYENVSAGLANTQIVITISEKVITNP